MQSRSRKTHAAAWAIALGMSVPFAGATGLSHADESILELAAESSELELLVTALQASSLDGPLRGDGPFTVFAPSDDAFEALGEGTLRTLLSEDGLDTLADVLKFHVVPGELTVRDIAMGAALETLSGQRITITTERGMLRVDGADLIATDIEASNGIVHVIDKVMMPEDRTIPELASETEGFGTLVGAVKAAGLVDALSGDGPFTVLAPTDDAFEALGADTIEALLLPRNRNKLAEVLTYHVIPARAFAVDAISAGTVETLAGQAVTFGIDNGRLTVAGANVIATDIEASNGVVHAIDRVLIPAGFSLDNPGEVGLIGIYPDNPTPDERRLLRLERGEGVRVSGVTSESGALDAGLRSGDVILAINGETATSEQLTDAKRDAGIGGTIRVVIAREVEIEVRRDDH